MQSEVEGSAFIMLITNGKVEDQTLKALADSVIIFIYTFLSALIVLQDVPRYEDLYIILLLSGSAFMLSYANKMGIELPGR